MKSSLLIRCIISVSIMLVLTCGENPVDPALDPNNATIKLVTEYGNVGRLQVSINQGDSLKIGVQIRYPHHFSRISIQSTCGIFQQNYTPDSTKDNDLFNFNPVFTTTGACTLFAIASYKNISINDKVDTLAFYVKPGTAGIEFVSPQSSIFTDTGTIDTLLYAVRTKGNVSAPEYSISSLPMLDQTQLSLLPSISKDTVRILFNPAAADTYAVSIIATVQVPGAASVKDTAKIGVRVYSAPTLALVDTTINGKKVSTPQITVACSAIDNGAGVAKVTYAWNGKSIDATAQPNNIWSGTIAGLENGKATEVTITATNRSLRKNSATLKFTVTYNTTVSDTTLSVIATPVYKVSFSLDGGTPAIPEQDVKQGGKATMPTSSPAKAGYEFAGWFTSQTFSTEFNFATQTITGGTVIYAKWVQVFTVTYDKNGAESGSAPVNSKKYKSGEFATVFGNTGGLQRNDYEFNGWNTSANGSGTVKVASDVITIGSASVVLYAMWKKLQCTITFDDQSATTAPNPTMRLIDVSTAIETLPAEPNKTSYVFDGWYTGTGGSGTKVTASSTFSSNTTVYAKWVIKDADGNVYTEVKIGNQVWIVENLKTTKYNDETSILLVSDTAAWAALTTPGYCWYRNDESNKSTYGALYNWYTVNTGKLAPKGWHVPTDAEWSTLEANLGESSVAGGKLKEAGTAHWSSPNEGATNESGFSALPGGKRNWTGYFFFKSDNGRWWSVSESNAVNAWYRGLAYDSAGLDKSAADKACGFSIRLVKD